ncbi:hypothetical protein G3M48_007522 [Beauveria asiatica]|uniref:Uncharacterized protein n=1 Tax=Beauveria asiatica TaxID=1069075 RepID=A0AAW0RLZ8_9HYPO
MPVKNSSGRGFCAGFWNKIRREKSPSRGEQVSSLTTQSATKTNPQTPDDDLTPHERPLLGELATINSTEQRSSNDCSLWDQAYNVLEERARTASSRLIMVFSRDSTRNDGAASSSPAPDDGTRNHAPDLPSLHNPVWDVSTVDCLRNSTAVSRTGAKQRDFDLHEQSLESIALPVRRDIFFYMFWGDDDDILVSHLTGDDLPFWPISRLSTLWILILKPA